MGCCDVNNCALDLTGQMLAHFYGDIKPRQPASERLRWVKQWNYLPNGTSTNSSRLMEFALLYVPLQCEDDPSACRVHINYHGCTKRVWQRREAWATLIDLNQYG